MRHLVKRFCGSLVKREILAVDRDWVASNLSSKELKLWSGQMTVDQAHSIQIARRFVVLMPDAAREEIAAALSHDVGKSISRLGVFARVLATILPARVARISPRFSSYLDHEMIGARMLREIGSSEVTVALVERTAATRAANALYLADQI